MTSTRTPRATIHTTGPRVHYVRYTADDRLSGPFRTKKAATEAVARANAVAR